jgi:tryptophan-rich sensory protein
MKIGTIVGAIAGAIVMFLLGFLFFGFLLADYFKANTIEYAGLVKDPPAMVLIFVFNLVWAWLIAWVLEYAGRNGWAEGAKAGAIIMFALALGINVEFEAFMNVHRSLTPLLVHILIVTIMGAVAGTVIGQVRGYFNRGPAEL